MPDLPPIVYWRMACNRTLLTILGPASLVKEALSRDHDRTRPNRTVIRAWIPWGTNGWRTKETEPWRPLSELPKEWGLRLVETNKDGTPDDYDMQGL